MADRLRFSTVESGHIIYYVLLDTRGMWTPCHLNVNRPEGGDKNVEIELAVEIECVDEAARSKFVSINGDQVYRTRLRFSDGNKFIVDVTIPTLDWDLEGAVISFDWRQAVSVLDHIEGC
ncbi:MAG: hypothetical protein LKI24_11005 [Acidipropionibacterium sp.]|nr:hypothetical protein [Acidipropionibacterium sp.]